MNTQAKQILADAMQLPENDRAELAAELISSLDAQCDDGAEQAWSDEIARRLDDLDSGKVTALPWSEAERIIRGTASDASSG